MSADPQQPNKEEERPRRPSPPAEDSLDAAFQRNLPGLIAFIRARLGARLASRESATELAQSVCREVLQDLDDFEYRGDAAFRGWMHKQAIRKILDRDKYWGRERRDMGRDVASSDDDLPSLVACYASIATPSRHASAREELERFESALGELPEAQREAVMMSRLMGLEYADIAEVLGVSASAVRGLVARGLAALADQLD